MPEAGLPGNLGNRFRSCTPPPGERVVAIVTRLRSSGIGIFDSGPVSHYLGGLATVLGRYEDAENYFTIAAALSEREGARFNAARTNLLWGRMLAARRAPGDAERARELLAIARTAAVANGYSNVEHRAAAALQLLDA